MNKLCRFFSISVTLYLKTLPLNKREASFSLLRPPTSTQVGVSDDCLLGESRIEVKDDVRAFDEVNVEPARHKKTTLTARPFFHRVCVIVNDVA